MGGKAVALERELSQEETEILISILNENDLTLRSTLIAFIIQRAVAKSENKQIAEDAVKTFKWGESKDPFGTTRALVTRTIKDLNSGQSVASLLAKRGKGNLELQRWSADKVRQQIRSLHHENPATFNYNFVQSANSALISHVEKCMGNFQCALAESGINPRVHLDDFPWGNEQETKNQLRDFLRDIERRCGIESLNYNTMYSTQSAIIGIEDQAHQDYEECKKHGCLKRIRGSAILRRIELIYGSYKEGACALLELSNDDFESLIERKSQEIPLDNYLERFQLFIDDRGDEWNIVAFAHAEHAAYRGLYNKKEQFSFIEEAYGDVMTAALAQITFEGGELSRDAFLKEEFERVVYEVKSRRTTNLQSRLEGYRFQALFLEMLESEAVGLTRGEDFLYEQFIDVERCVQKGHSPKCRMDFVFPDFIVDTKRSVTAGRRIAGQTERYLDHTNHLIRVTLRQRYKSTVAGPKRLTTMTVYEFIEMSEDLIGVQVDAEWKGRFEAYEAESAQRIALAIEEQVAGES